MHGVRRAVLIKTASLRGGSALQLTGRRGAVLNWAGCGGSGGVTRCAPWREERGCQRSQRALRRWSDWPIGVKDRPSA
eukprot:62522-Alexandrium_andersonii.AAC.1